MYNWEMSVVLELSVTGASENPLFETTYFL